MAALGGGETDRRLGLLAFGDSITNGGGELQWGVALQSWAQWTARGLGIPFTGYAVDGAQARDVVERQINTFQRATADPAAPYDVGSLYIGVNDVRAEGWDIAAYEHHLGVAARFLAARCTRLLMATLPLDLGRPRTSEKRILDASAAVRRVAASRGALVLELGDFGARNLVMTDHIHPTAFGQIALAQRALAVLAADGMRVALDPRVLVTWNITRWKRLRGDATYAYRHLKVSSRAVVRRRPPTRDWEPFLPPWGKSDRGPGRGPR